MRAEKIASALFCAALIIAISGCRQMEDLLLHDVGGTRHEWATPGIFVGESLTEELRETFSDIALRRQRNGNFDDLAIVFSHMFRRPIPRFHPYAPTDGGSAPENPIDPPPVSPPWRFEPPNHAVVSFFDDGFWHGFEMATISFLENTAVGTPYASGVSVSAELVAYAASLFQLTKTCTGHANGAVEELSLNLESVPFPCAYGGGNCWGSYVPPNVILAGNDAFVLRHEFVHYLLWRNTGSADPAHESPFFETCVE